MAADSLEKLRLGIEHIAVGIEVVLDRVRVGRDRKGAGDDGEVGVRGAAKDRAGPSTAPGLVVGRTEPGSPTVTSLVGLRVEGVAQALLLPAGVAPDLQVVGTPGPPLVLETEGARTGAGRVAVDPPVPREVIDVAVCAGDEEAGREGRRLKSTGVSVVSRAEELLLVRRPVER